MEDLGRSYLPVKAPITRHYFHLYYLEEMLDTSMVVNMQWHILDPVLSTNITPTPKTNGIVVQSYNTEQ